MIELRKGDFRISDIETKAIRVNHRGNWIHVIVHTDEGFTGLGEASHSGSDACLCQTVEQLKQLLIGRDGSRIEAVLNEFSRPRVDRVTQTALSGIEQALWDILGQRLGVPIHVLFGGNIRDRIRLYANINRHVTDRSPEGFALAAEMAVRDGFTAIKLAPFDELAAPDRIRTGPRASWRRGVERVLAVRSAIGPEVELAVDCHCRMEASEAIVVGKALLDCELFWFEEPVSHIFPEQLARVTSEVPMPVASCEGILSLEALQPCLAPGVLDVIMPDLKHVGGLLEMKRIAGAARMAHILVSPHNPAGPVATAASAQVMSTVSNFMILEYAWGEADWRAQLLDPPEQIEDGYLVLPKDPGLGHRLNPSVAETHREH